MGALCLLGTLQHKLGGGGRGGGGGGQRGDGVKKKKFNLHHRWNCSNFKAVIKKSC